MESTTMDAVDTYIQFYLRHAPVSSVFHPKI
jgi:hypothetical protein